MDGFQIDVSNMTREEQNALDAMKKQLATARSEMQKLQRHVVYVENSLEEAQTALLVAGKKLADQDAKIKQIDAKNKFLSAATDEKIRQLKDRLRIAPQVDKALSSLYVELRSQLCDRFGAPGMSAAELESTERASPLVMASKLRVWIRRMFTVQQQQQPMSASTSINGGINNPTAFMSVRFQAPPAQLQHQLSTGAPPPLTSIATMGDRTSPVLDDEYGSFTVLDASGRFSASDAQSPQNQRQQQVAFETEVKVKELQKENASLKRKLDTLDAEMEAKKQDQFQFEQHCRLTADLARREAANVRQDVRSRDKQIEQLNAELKKNDIGAQSRMQLLRAQQEADDAKKNMKTALQAKQQEIEVMKRNFTTELKDQQAFISTLRKQKTDAAKLETKVRHLEGQKDLLQGQLVRTNVKGLVEDRRRALRIAEEKQNKIDQLEKEAFKRETSVRFLESTHKKMTEEYNAIFEAHYREQMDKRKRQQKADEQAAATSIKGPNSELNLSYFRSRYQEVLKDLKQTQKKMKHLILMSHHDHLTFNRQKDVLSEQLSEVKDQRNEVVSILMNSPSALLSGGVDGSFDTTVSSRNPHQSMAMPQGGVVSYEEWEMQRHNFTSNSLGGDVHTLVGSDGVESAGDYGHHQRDVGGSRAVSPNAQTTNTYKAYRPHQELIDDDEDTRVTTESIRVSPTSTFVEQSFPHYGAETDFGSPLDSEAVIRYRTKVDNVEKETSTRAASKAKHGIAKNLVNTEVSTDAIIQEDKGRGRGRKTPLSEQGRVFEFTAVGTAKMSQLGKPGRLAGGGADELSNVSNMSNSRPSSSASQRATSAMGMKSRPLSGAKRAPTPTRTGSGSSSRPGTAATKKKTTSGSCTGLSAVQGKPMAPATRPSSALA